MNRKALISGLLLTYVGGFLDGYTYLGRGHVFANAQTGNMALLGISLFRGDGMQVLHYLLPISAFALGSLLTKQLERTTFSKRLVSAIEILILAFVALAGSGLADQYANMLISFVCAMQVTAFRQIDGLPLRLDHVHRQPAFSHGKSGSLSLRERSVPAQTSSKIFSCHWLLYAWRRLFLCGFVLMGALKPLFSLFDPAMSYRVDLERFQRSFRLHKKRWSNHLNQNAHNPQCGLPSKN